MLLELLRVGLSPFLVAGASLASRRWGEAVGGWLAGFPFVAGPILLVVALEHGLDFAQASARTALLGMVALSVFALWFAWTSRVWPWGVALVSGWLVYLVVAFAVSWVDFGTLSNFVLVVATLALTLRLLPGREKDASVLDPRPEPLASAPEPVIGNTLPSPARNPWDIPARMAATLVLVCSLTLAARFLGPRWSGLLTPFPVATTVLAVFAHRAGGPAAVGRFLRGFVPGLGSLAVFFAALYASLLWHPSMFAFAQALLAAIVVHTAIAWMRTRGAS